MREDDLSHIYARLDAAEIRQETQSEKIDRLLESYEIQSRVFLENMGEQALVLEYMEMSIQDAHADTDSKIESLRPARHFETPRQSTAFVGFETIRTEKLLIGEIEKVRLTPPGGVFHARIDTGATTSSIDARDIEPFERDGSAWIRFKVEGLENDSIHEIEKRIVRYVRVFQSSDETGDRRPVVKLQFQLGPIEMIEDFTLSDRKHLDYQVLIGRNILKDLMVVDVAQKFIVPLPAPKINEGQ